MFGILQKLAEVTSVCTGSYPPTCTTTNTAGAGIFGLVFFLIYLPILVLIIVSMWKVFTKAGKPGWASIVPIYNVVVELEIIGRPLWWIILFLIPIVNFVVAIIILFDLAKAFGKDALFGLVLLFLPIIGFPMLAFGKAKYVGPVASGGSNPPAAPKSPTPPTVSAPPAVTPTPPPPAQPPTT